MKINFPSNHETNVDDKLYQTNVSVVRLYTEPGTVDIYRHYCADYPDFSIFRKGHRSRKFVPSALVVCAKAGNKQVRARTMCISRSKEAKVQDADQ